MVAGAREPCDDAAVVFENRSTAFDDDIKSLIRLPLLDHIVTGECVYPPGRSDHLPDFRVREFLKEAQLLDPRELLVLLELRWRVQLARHSGQFDSKFKASFVALVPVFFQRLGDHRTELLRCLHAQRRNSGRGFV